MVTIFFKELYIILVSYIVPLQDHVMKHRLGLTFWEEDSNWESEGDTYWAEQAGRKVEERNTKAVKITVFHMTVTKIRFWTFPITVPRG